MVDIFYKFCFIEFLNSKNVIANQIPKIEQNCKYEICLDFNSAKIDIFLGKGLVPWAKTLSNKKGTLSLVLR